MAPAPGTLPARSGRVPPAPAAVVIRPGREQRLRAGHLWVYRTEIARIEGEPEDGDAVAVRTASGRHLGVGLLNTRSVITVRLFTTDDRPLDEAFFADRLNRAAALRARLGAALTACRLVYSEGDGLPGLIVDRYNDVLVIQTLTLGMDKRKEMLAGLLDAIVHPRGIYARNDPTVRRLEGLPRQTGWIRGGGPTEVEVEEGGCRFLVDIAAGQKTGFFLDQRENRARAAELAAGARVLDGFAYTGAWGIQAAAHGAVSVTGMEISGAAVAGAERNAARNGCSDRCRWLRENAFDGLRRLAAAGPGFDLVILDPPAFVKTKAALAGGLAGYKEINLRALKVLGPDGWLVTCSCSYHVSEAHLVAVVNEAARDARRRIRILEVRSQARDHPVHPAMPELRYLKCLIVAVE
ncbi:MAG TPA: class I SAM-dependent rRNA methyltransferase [bacterium]|nr:class I SAM-dependent rRNA methyltransferase [bacterium]